MPEGKKEEEAGRKGGREGGRKEGRKEKATLIKSIESRGHLLAGGEVPKHDPTCDSAANTKRMEDRDLSRLLYGMFCMRKEQHAAACRNILSAVPCKIDTALLQEVSLNHIEPFEFLLVARQKRPKENGHAEEATSA